MERSIKRVRSCVQACLEDGICPFTKQLLTWQRCTILTKNNIERFRDLIRD